jgi:hypothetical protein|tara:strand:- start:1236 stop:1589 length:354 start_codon:yes stop_codon:yes gene_type:complete
MTNRKRLEVKITSNKPPKGLETSTARLRKFERYTVSKPARIRRNGDVSNIWVYQSQTKELSGHFTLEERYGGDTNFNTFGVEEDFDSAKETILRRAREEAQKELEDLGVPQIAEYLE